MAPPRCLNLLTWTELLGCSRWRVVSEWFVHSEVYIRLGGDDAEIFMEKFRGSVSAYMHMYMHVLGSSVRVGWLSPFHLLALAYASVFFLHRERLFCA